MVPTKPKMTTMLLLCCCFVQHTLLNKIFEYDSPIRPCELSISLGSPTLCQNISRCFRVNLTLKWRPMSSRLTITRGSTSCFGPWTLDTDSSPLWKWIPWMFSAAREIPFSMLIRPTLPSNVSLVLLDCLLNITTPSAAIRVAFFLLYLAINRAFIWKFLLLMRLKTEPRSPCIV